MNDVRWFGCVFLVLSGVVQAGIIGPDSPSCPVTQNPVHLIKRWKFLERTDIEAPIKFSRTYTSRPDSGVLGRTGLGTQWMHSYSRRILPNGHPLPNRAFEVYLVRDDGTALSFSSQKFKNDKCDQWLSRQPGSGSLFGVCSGTTLQYYRYRTPEGEERYDPSGKLIRLVGADGVRLDLSYFPDGKLQQVVNDTGRSLDFSWNGNEIKGIRPNLGPTVSYLFDDGKFVGTTGALKDEVYEYAIAGYPRLLTTIKSVGGVELLKVEYMPGQLAEGYVKETFSLLESGVPVNKFKYSAVSGGVQIENPLGLLTTVISNFMPLYVDGRLSNELNLVTNRSSNCSSCGSDGFQSMTYDVRGNVDIAIDFNGNVTDFDYSDDGLLLRKVEGKGTPEARTISFGYTRQVESARFTCGGEVAVCDRNSASLAEMVTKQFSDVGGVRPVAECRHDVDLGSAKNYVCGTERFAPRGVLQTINKYCTATDSDFGTMTCPLEGRLKRVEGPRGDGSDMTHYYYYMNNASAANCSTGQCYKKGDLAWTFKSSPSSLVAYLSYNYRGQPLRIQDANETVAVLGYDGVGRLRSRTVGGSLFESIDYDSLGQVWRVFGANGAGTEYCRDQAQRITAEVNVQRGNVSACNGGAIPIVAGFEATKYVLDAAGNRVREAVVNADGQEVRVSAQSFTTESRLFESFRAPHSLDPEDPKAKRTTYAYDGNGNLETITDPLGRVTKQQYDSLNRLERVIEDFGGSPSHLNATTIFGYDTLSQLRTVQDAEGLITKYIYNGLQRQTEVQSPDAGTQRFTHDGAGNVRSKTDARGVVISYDYDADNRLREVDYPNDTDAIFEYDIANPVCGSEENFPQGRLSRMVDASGTTLFCYDARGNLTRKRQVHSDGALEVRYEYGSDDLLSRIHYPSGLVVHYSRDLRGRVASVGLWLPSQNWTFDVASQIGYLPNGPLSSITFGGTQSLTKAWDKNYDIDSIGGSQLGLDFSTNDLGLIDEISGVSYGYDAQNRLNSVLSPMGTTIEGFRYDKIGNRLEHETASGQVAYAYQPGSHRLAAVGGLGRGYDAAGNTLSGHLPPTWSGRPRQVYYDERGRLAEFRYKDTSGALVTEYRWTYNELGERVRTRRVNALTPLDAPLGSEFLFNENAQLLSEKVVSAVSEGGDSRIPVDRFREIVWVDDIPVAFVVLRGSLPEVYYIHSDHLNTPRALTRAHEIGGNSAGTVAWEWSLIGDGVSAFGSHAALGHVGFSLRYPGQQWDAFSKWNYNYLRTYEPGTGRYLESDPIGLRGGVALFGYAHGDPLRFVDPTGESALLTAGVALAGGGAMALTVCVLRPEICGFRPRKRRPNDHIPFPWAPDDLRFGRPVPFEEDEGVFGGAADGPNPIKCWRKFLKCQERSHLPGNKDIMECLEDYSKCMQDCDFPKI